MRSNYVCSGSEVTCVRFSLYKDYARETACTERALIAQSVEHIHGKDEVISSILIEGWQGFFPFFILK